MRTLERLQQDGSRSSISTRKRRLILGSVVGALLCCAALALVSRGGSNPGRRMPSPPVAIVPQAAPGQHGPIEVVRFSLYDVGIYPAEAHVGKGLVAVTIEDLSGGSTGLIVEQEKGLSRVTVGSVQRLDHWRARNEMRLEPGRYEVYMANRPENRAVLIVEP